MNDKHIIDILDKAPLATLDEKDREIVEAHARACAECHQALTAAMVATAMLRERSAESFSAPPFFETRVLAALREKRAERDFWSLGRMWRTAGALVSSMAFTVALLGVMSFVVPGTEYNGEEAISAYSADAALLGHIDLSDEQVTDGQILNTLYESDEEIGR